MKFRGGMAKQGAVRIFGAFRMGNSMALLVPALWKGPAAPLGFLELVITAGFASAAALTYLAFIRNVPILPWPHRIPESSTHH